MNSPITMIKQDTLSKLYQAKRMVIQLVEGKTIVRDRANAWDHAAWKGLIESLARRQRIKAVSWFCISKEGETICYTKHFHYGHRKKKSRRKHAKQRNQPLPIKENLTLANFAKSEDKAA